MSRRDSAGGFGWPTLTALVVANMIGAGVFTTSGFALADLHTPGRVILAWWVAGAIALCGAVAYGAIAEAVRGSGGEYLYLSRVFHPAIGFLAGWVSLLAGFTGAIALAALTLETYLYPAHGWVAASAILLAACLHGFHKGPGALAQNVMVMIKVVFLIVLIVVAWKHLPTPPEGVMENNIPAFSTAAFAESLMWISLSYAGFNAAIYIAGEASQAKLVSRSLILGTGVTMLLYVGLNTVFVRAAPYDSLAGQPEVAAIAFDALGLPFASSAFRIVVPLALFTSVTAMMLAGPRVYAQMANDGYLPAFLRFEASKEVPKSAIGFQTLLALAFVAFGSIRDLLSYLGFTLSLSSAVAVSTLFVLHHRGQTKISLASRLAAIIYIGMTLLCASIGAWLNPWQGLAGLLTLLVGYAVYLAFRRSSTVPDRLS